MALLLLLPETRQRLAGLELLFWELAPLHDPQVIEAAAALFGLAFEPRVSNQYGREVAEVMEAYLGDLMVAWNVAESVTASGGCAGGCGPACGCAGCRERYCATACGA